MMGDISALEDVKNKMEMQFNTKLAKPVPYEEPMPTFYDDFMEYAGPMYNHLKKKKQLPFIYDYDQLREKVDLNRFMSSMTSSRATSRVSMFSRYTKNTGR